MAVAGQSKNDYYSFYAEGVEPKKGCRASPDAEMAI